MKIFGGTGVHGSPATKAAGVDFVGRVPAGHENLFPEGVAVIFDLADLTL